MAYVNCIPANLAFQNVECSFTELFELLPQLRSYVYPKSTEYSPNDEVLRAICRHLENAAYKLQFGIQSLGIIMANAKDDQNNVIASRDITSLGWLLQILGDLLIACNTTESNITNELVKRGVSS